VSSGRRRPTAGRALAALLLVACSDPELEARLDELEQRLAAVESRSQELQPAAESPVMPPVTTPERENAAAILLRDASTAIDALDWDSAKTLLAQLRADYGDTRAAKATARLVSEVEAIGKPEAPLEVERWLTGSADDLRAGRATIYVFWEAWCSHCQRDLPRMAELYDRNKARGLRVVGVTRMSKGVTEEQALAFVKDLGVGYPNAQDSGETLSRYYNVTGIPAAAVVKDGKVVWRGGPHKLTDAFVQQWL
jgi:peroxiredoxin